MAAATPPVSLTRIGFQGSETQTNEKDFSVEFDLLEA